MVVEMKLYVFGFNLFVVVLVNVQFFDCSHADQSAVCRRPCHGSMNESYVTEYCEEHSLTLEERCCINTTESSHIVGIDLQHCDLSNLTGLFSQQTDLRIILLQDNPIPNVTSSDFNGLLNLEYLALPPAHACPGGWEAWEASNTTANETLCLQEVDFCHTYNISCPVNSDCVNTGPGINQCLCSPGYHGYKCLRQGTFPTLIFSTGMAGSVLVIASFLWITQRRKVKKNA